MPAKSKANETSFKKGHIPWNKVDISEKVKIICKNCGNIFYVRPNELKHRNVQFCSRKCMDVYRREHSKYKNLVKLRLEDKKTIKELSEYYNVSSGTISRELVKRKCRLPAGNSEGSIIKKLKDEHKKIKNGCVICGFNRFIELAHIVSAKDGGKYELENTVLLCPNHHRLFDAGLLNKKEIKKIKKYQNYIKGKIERERSIIERLNNNIEYAYRLKSSI